MGGSSVPCRSVSVQLASKIGRCGRPPSLPLVRAAAPFASVAALPPAAPISAIHRYLTRYVPGYHQYPFSLVALPVSVRVALYLVIADFGYYWSTA